MVFQLAHNHKAGLIYHRAAYRAFEHITTRRRCNTLGNWGAVGPQGRNTLHGERGRGRAIRIIQSGRGTHFLYCLRLSGFSMVKATPNRLTGVQNTFVEV